VGCLSRAIVVVAVLVQLIAGSLVLIVLGSAGVLGNAAIISADDAVVVFFATVASLVATVILAVKIWMSSRAKKRMSRGS